MDIISKFYSALPQIRIWIDVLLDRHKENAVSVSTLSFPRIEKAFPMTLLEKTKVVYVDKIPYPPLSKMGLHELSAVENMDFIGVTYKDTFFVNRLHCTESLHFHELIHAAQWDRLGVDNFLLAYGVGLIQFEYKQSPFEDMAYTFQRNFENGIMPHDIISEIHKKTDAIWNHAKQLLENRHF